MNTHKVSLSTVSLYADVADSTSFIVEIGLAPERRRTRCSIVGWPEGQVDAIERRLARYRMPVVHASELSYFWARTKYVMVAVGLVTEAFAGMYDFDPPEFWYNVNGEPYKDDAEFRVEDRDPSKHDRIIIECTNWRNETEVGRELYVERLRDSGLCVPASIFYEEDTADTRFYVGLTPDAAHKPLETFPALLELHPATAGNARAKTA